MTKTRKKELGPGDDLEMMSCPMNWPRWPILPVKRYRPDMECGVMVAVAGMLTRVILSNMCYLSKDWNEVKKLPHIEYSSYEAILADGWVVD